MSDELIVMRPSELKRLLIETLDEREAAKKEREDSKTSVTIHKAASILGRHQSTVKKYVNKGILKTTTDGRIPMAEINRYMNGL